MKTDLEKFQEIVADINTIIFGKPVNNAKAQEFSEWFNLALKYKERAQYQAMKCEDLKNQIKSWDEMVNTYKDKPKPKRKRGRPKGSKNKVKKATSKRNKWL